MNPADDKLMAYADGELDAAGRAEVEAAMAADPTIARAVERHRALRRRLQSAYAGVLEEAVPERLREGLAEAEPAQASGSAVVTDLAARRAQRSVAPRAWLPQWAAMAASLTLGLLVGWLVLQPPASPFAEQDGQLLARGELAGALATQAGGTPGAGAVRVGFTFRDRAGDYCRTFRVEDAAALAGYACQRGGEWQVRVLAEAEPGGSGLRTAGSLPATVLQAVDAAIDGEPLDAEAEAAAQAAGWQAR